MKVNTYVEIINKNCTHGGIKDAGILSGILSVALRDPEVSLEDFRMLLSFINENIFADIREIN